MKKKKNKIVGAAVPPVSVPPVVSPELCSTTLRLPEHLSQKMKDCAAFYGVSLNAVVCIALGDFLKDKGFL
ncbi:hypothetical protein ACUUL3_08195 [Thiovibrio sp. JS02]